MNVHVVINPVAGQDEPVLAVLSRVFARLDIPWTPQVTTPEVSAGDLTRVAIEQGAERVFAYGGDGTISEVGASLIGTGVPLGVLPGGTGNVIAQELDLPLELEAAAELAASTQETRALDTLRMGEASSMLRIGVGADARMIRDAEREKKDRLGWAAYLFSALQQVVEPEYAEFRLTVDGRVLEGRAVTCVVANIGRIGRGGLSLAPEIDPSDGLADVLLIRDSGLLGMASVGTSVLGLARDPEDEEGPLVHVRAREVTIETEPTQPVHADGDLVDGDPSRVSIELVPGSLPVLVSDLQ